MDRIQKITSDFKIIADKNHLSHAYLFFGEEFNEIFSFAKSLANYLENGIFEEPKKILEESLIISPNEKGNIGIDEIRKVSNFLYQKPVFSKKRTAIICKSDELSLDAQNAALKITEESPNQSLIIFIAKNEDSLLPPLSSRLQKIYFPAAQNLQEKKHLKPKIKLPLSKKDIDEIVENDKIDELFEFLIDCYRKDPVKNNEKLKEILKRLTLFKKYNINKKLQLKCLS
ncbi:hypothetical protein HZC33_02190 [Candidatus Wolfebacteria bacterium]|nr:hypothetical protein [Candidatus Wolfebacteria bacterium]